MSPWARRARCITSSLGLIAHAYPAGHVRIRALGICGASFSAGTATGPLIAGGFAEVDWRLGYVVFAAASLLVVAAAARVLGESKGSRGGRPDLPGALALGAALTTLLSAQTLGRNGWLRAPVASRRLQPDGPDRENRVPAGYFRVTSVQ
ncbi:MFS transporter [Streptomyces sp. NPDC002076]